MLYKTATSGIEDWRHHGSELSRMSESKRSDTYANGAGELTQDGDEEWGKLGTLHSVEGHRYSKSEQRNRRLAERALFICLSRKKIRKDFFFFDLPDLLFWWRGSKRRSSNMDSSETGWLVVKTKDMAESTFLWVHINREEKWRDKENLWLFFFSYFETRKGGWEKRERI